MSFSPKVSSVSLQKTRYDPRKTLSHKRSNVDESTTDTEDSNFGSKETDRKFWEVLDQRRVETP